MVNLTGKTKLLEYLSLLREKIPTFLLVTFNDERSCGEKRAQAICWNLPNEK